jgi:hypothetical protein
MTAPLLASRALRGAATLRLAASSVAPVASGYARSLRPCDAGVSRAQSGSCKESGL